MKPRPHAPHPTPGRPLAPAPSLSPTALCTPAARPPRLPGPHPLTDARSPLIRIPAALCGQRGRVRRNSPALTWRAGLCGLRLCLSPSLCPRVAQHPRLGALTSRLTGRPLPRTARLRGWGGGAPSRAWAGVGRRGAAAPGNRTERRFSSRVGGPGKPWHALRSGEASAKRPRSSAGQAQL